VQATTTFRGDHTRGYAAPEQVNSTEANKRADIYSFGKVMAFTLTRGTDPDRVPYDSWRYLIHRCTERDPTLRPSAKEVLAELKALVP
jgi:serine/threonine protein kinase